MHVGIDLGTSYSLIARVDEHGTPVLFPDRHESQRFQTPSVVHIGPEGALVGQPVEERLEDAPDLPVCRFPKLSMGRNEAIFVDHLERAWHPEAISALILKKLVGDVATFTDEPIDGAVVSVPAYFSDPQRQATRHAAELAGLKVLELVEEPLAAAVHYGARSVPPGTRILVYDLGGGTFDATVLHVDSGGLFPLATDGALDLGGKSCDEAIMVRIADQFRQQMGYDPLNDPVASVHLRREAEAIKIKLAMPGKDRVRKGLILGGRSQEITMTRAQFEHAIRPMVDRTTELCARALGSKGLDWSAIDRILLAGGSSLIPYVRNAVIQASGKPAERVESRQPHYAIAYGAALIAAQHAGPAAAAGTDGPRLHRIAGFDLGCRVRDYATGKPSVKTVIARNSPIPDRQTIVLYTTRPDQSRIVLDIVQVKGQGEPPVSLGNFEFPIRRPRKNHPLEVTIGYDEYGMASVVARNPDTDQVVQRDFPGARNPMDRILEQKSLLESVRLAD